MSSSTRPRFRPAVYPDSDGKPMAENTLQFQWIVTLQGNIDLLFADRSDVFVAGDNLIYPVMGEPGIRQAPDVYVAFGRPKGYRGSYRLWEEGYIFPQVVIEVLSPGNRAGELRRKLAFYSQYGAEEYYIYDPYHGVLTIYIRRDNALQLVAESNGWVSPRLGVRFETGGNEMVVYGPDNQKFLTFLELGERAEQERQRAEQERAKAVRLAAKLRELGVDPESL